jgi:fructose-bisphosphate aldolase class I
MSAQSKEAKMKSMELASIANAMVAEGKGILAIDESTGTCKKRFDSIGVECTAQNRRDYRGMLLSTPGLGEHISGAILYDETLHQSTTGGTSFVQLMTQAGILPGIKVDTGAHPLAGHPGEKVTEGLDGLRPRLEKYHSIGACFAKWRAVITIGENIPTSACIEANTHALARYAALCQEAGLVPIVEPEVLMDGPHSLDECYEVSEATLRSLFMQLYDQGVLLEGTILKASMVISGSEAEHRADVQEVADATLECLLNSVPAALAGVVFLSGGQSDQEATRHLDAMNRSVSSPWPLSFSYGRALQSPSLKVWGENPSANVAVAQEKLAHRAKMNGLAATGSYEPSLEAG